MSKSSILAIGIAAILMMCALSGAVILANNGSDNGNSDDGKISDVRSMTSNITKNTTSVRDYQTKTASTEETVMPLLPETTENFTIMLSEVAEDTILSDFLDGRSFEMADTVYTIDSDTAALSYLYSLGFMSIGDSFVLDTYGVNTIEEEETADAVEKTEADGKELLLTASREKTGEVKELALKKTTQRDAVLVTAVGADCVDYIHSSRFIAFEGLTVAEFRDANILMQPATLQKEIVKTKAPDMLLQVERLDCDVVLAEGVKESIEVNCVDNVMKSSEKSLALSESAMKKNSMFRECMLDALCSYMYENAVEEEQIYDGSILDILKGSVFSIAGVPMMVEDAQTLASYLYCNFGFQVIGTSIIAVNYIPIMTDAIDCMYALNVCKSNSYNEMFDRINCSDIYMKYDYAFFNVEEVSPYIFTDIVDNKDAQMTVRQAHMMGNAYAACVISSFIQYGTMSNEYVYDMWGMTSEKIELPDVDEAPKDEIRSNELLESFQMVKDEKLELEVDRTMPAYDTVLDVLMYTPFFYEGEFMTVEDMDTLGLFLSEQFLVITNENEMSFASFNMGEYDCIRSFTLEDMPAMIFADFLKNDYINTDGFGCANVYDGGYFCMELMDYECLKGEELLEL